MPYADPEAQREAQAKHYREKYNAKPRFRKSEAKRKADWYQRKKADDPTFSARMAAKRMERYYAAKSVKIKAKAKTKTKTKSKAKAKAKA